MYPILIHPILIHPIYIDLQKASKVNELLHQVTDNPNTIPNPDVLGRLYDDLNVDPDELILQRTHMEADDYFQRLAATEDYGIAWNNDEQAPNGQLIMVPLPVDDDNRINSLSPVPPPPVGPPPADNNECTMLPSPLFAESDNDNVQELNDILNTNAIPLFPVFPPALELDDYDELLSNNNTNTDNNIDKNNELNDNVQELNNILNTNNAIPLFPAPPALELDDELVSNNNNTNNNIDKNVAPLPLQLDDELASNNNNTNTDNKALISSNGIAYNTSSSSFVYNITFINNIYVNTFFVNIINTKSGTTSSSLPISIKNESSFAPTSLPIYHTNIAPPNTNPTNFVISPTTTTTTIKRFKAKSRKPGFKVDRNKAKKGVNGNQIVLKIENPWLQMNGIQFKLRKQLINGKLGKKYQCFEKYCRRRNNITQPQRHVMEMYHPEREFYVKKGLVCLECDKVFTSGYKKKIHTQEQCAQNRLKPYECSTCFRRYKYSHDCSLQKATLEIMD